MELAAKRTRNQGAVRKMIVLASKAFAGTLILIGCGGDSTGPGKMQDMANADGRVSDGGTLDGGFTDSGLNDMGKKGMCPDFTTKTAFVVNVKESNKNLSTMILKVGDSVTIGANIYKVGKDPMTSDLLLVTDNNGIVNSNNMQLTGVVTLDVSAGNATVLFDDGNKKQQFIDLSVVGISQIGVAASFESNVNYFSRAVVTVKALDGALVQDILDQNEMVTAKSLDGKTTVTAKFLDGDNSTAVLYISGTSPKGIIDQTIMLQEGQLFANGGVGVMVTLSEVQNEFDKSTCIALTAQLKYVTDAGQTLTSLPLNEGSVLNLNNGITITLDKVYYDPNPSNQYVKVTATSGKTSISAVLNTNGDPITAFKGMGVGSISLVGVQRTYVEPDM